MPKRSTVEIDKQPTPEELLEQCQVRKKGGTKCWAAYLEGDAKRFVEGCRRKHENNEPFSISEAARLAQKWYGIPVKRCAFTAHVHGRCDCSHEEKD